MTDLATDIAGRVMSIAKAPGDPVSAGEAVIVVEAMKMEIGIVAEADGVVDAVLVAVDQMIDEDQVIARIRSAS
jgi:biotin carboxyl carrier protein